MRLLVMVISMLLAGQSIAQPTLQSIEFIPVFQGEKLIPGKYYFDPVHGDSIAIDLLKFYISAYPTFSRENHDQIALLMMNDETNQMKFNVMTKTSGNDLSLGIGIDSIMNCAGALGGPLDPSAGMYWTWNTGYINVKIEGRSVKSSALKHEFQFHIGGYSGQGNAFQSIQFSHVDESHVSIEIELAEFFAQTDLSQKPQVMSPGLEGSRLARVFASTFHLSKK